MDKRTEKILRLVLAPLTPVYALAMRVRNYLYDSGRRKSIHFDTKVIAVGNLATGGTGKTPHIEYLIRMLKDDQQVTTLSRGYGRKTKGFILAGKGAIARQIGDEPMQFFSKFGQEITVAVGEDRALAIPCILFERPETQVILLDDAYQHRSVVPDLNVLLTEFHKPFFEDTVLPLGNLREGKYGAKRADVVIVTKCPMDLSLEKQKAFEASIQKYAKDNTPVFFTGIDYAEPSPAIPFTDVFLLTGIADPSRLEEHVSSRWNLLESRNFGDHHSFTLEEMQALVNDFKAYAQKDKVLMTTEKDMMRIQGEGFAEVLEDVPVVVMPITVKFLDNAKAFEALVRKVVEADSDKL